MPLASTPPAPRRATIVDVARRAGVSKSLASRALRGEAGVSEASRHRISAAAEELGYRLNSPARALVQGASGLIGVLLNEIGNQHHTAIVEGVEACAAEQGARVILAHGSGDARKIVSQLDTFTELRVDGLIIVSSWVPHDALAAVGAETPTVVVSRLLAPPDTIDTIASDDAAGARAAVTHLIASGRRSIGYLTRSESPTSRARTDGMFDALAAADLEGRVFSVGTGRGADLGTLFRSRICDGLLCNNDLTAAEALRVARLEGISVPGELALIGYDNTPLAEVLRPALTSVDQPQYRMGFRAATLLVERIDGRRTPLHEQFMPRLVVRESSTDT